MESEGGGVQLPKDLLGEAGNGSEIGQTVRCNVRIPEHKITQSVLCDDASLLNSFLAEEKILLKAAERNLFILKSVSW